MCHSADEEGSYAKELLEGLNECGAQLRRKCAHEGQFSVETVSENPNNKKFKWS
jgi:hypothetical protein